MDDKLKIEWAKVFLSPGIRKKTYSTKLTFTSKEWLKFFDWAQTNNYTEITKYLQNGMSVEKQWDDDLVRQVKNGAPTPGKEPAMKGAE